ncbi:MAG: branched-chain alpha-keto acid dehydrogenase subunit E2 [Acidimicrobiaceae bacterium]|nr:branched-chain alpha-keto acid dehydrogenase subunit E2 [Acidimicrobiaceae bacterium]
MSSFTMKLPDVGEGVAEAEIVEWLVAVGDEVTPDSPIAEVLTDKATVEISAPVTGTVAVLHGEPGDVLAVGADLVEIETQGDVEAVPEAEADAEADADAEGETEADAPTGASEPAAPAVTESDASGDTSPVVAETSSPAPEPTADSDRPKPTAAPAVRARAKELGIDLAEVDGTGPDGRIVHADLDRLRGGSRLARSTRGSESSGAATVSGAGTPHAVRGVRRRIAERLTSAWTEIPHITYVDAVDVTEVERLRRELNVAADADAQRLTLLPFLATAIIVAVRDHSGVNAHYDHAAETLTTFDAVHVGVATQTDDGLRVPVVRHAESHDLRSLADEIARVTEAARTGNATRDELTGSTITITSLGALGGIVTTPILNPPEVAIVGVNKIETRPVWEDGTWVPRQMMNLSSSFDHRMVDGWDAAVFVQRLKQLLQSPALLFVDE